MSQQSTISKMDTPTRRQFLSLSGIAAATAASGLVSAPSLLAQDKQKEKPIADQRNPWIYHFKIGEIDAWSISDGFMNIRQGLSLMYPESERENMAQALKEQSEPLDHLPLYVNILVIKKGNEIALFDAGFGAPEKNNRGWLVSGLEQIGIEPDDVTHTFLSHTHSDHIAGFTTDGKPTFKNAAFYITPEEYKYWRSPNPDFSKTKRDPKAIPGMIKNAQKHLEILTPNKQFSPVGAELLGGAVTIENGFGHTPGHALFRIRCQETNEELLHTVDLAHNHILMFQDPTWNIGWDNNLEMAAQTRKRVFSQAAAKKTRTYGFHLPFPGLGRIAPKGKGYTWIPERLFW
ncbi:MAG: glyoxylase-like metal-dependent hydrolase (beta-lactamase superfamily II) [Rubritalea sp.]|jgi:glyoxylase-like metal-dependent hydrolase (beta-lactamase superfamily II)